MRRIEFAVFYFTASLLLHSCAHKVAPTGGPKDVQSPVLLSAVPENYEVNFSADKIVLTFNEYVQLKEAQKQILFSPPMNPAPRIELKKKSVVIELPDTLKSNATYIINFGNAISDFTEGNALQNFQYVFSTGSSMDSLRVSGLILDAQTMKPLKEALTLLYDSETADSLIGKVPPSYYARTTESGGFTISNVREGSYRLVGLDDKNNNFIAELSDESIGTGTEIINVKDSSFVVAYLSKQPPLKQTIKSGSFKAPGILVTGFAKPVGEVSWNFIGVLPREVIPVFSAFRDTVTLYCFPELGDSATVEWSDNTLVIDTVAYRVEKSKTTSKTVGESKATAITYPHSGGILNPETMPSVLWSAPLRAFDFLQVKVFKDSLEFPVKGYFSDSLQLRTVFDGTWKTGNYEISIPAGAAENRYGSFNDSIRLSFNIPDERAKGSIAFSILSRTSDNLLLQLISDKDEIVRERKVSGTQKGLFEQLSPGIYRLRMVDDANANGRWDAGEIRNNIRPEKVVYYKDPVTVRANWEVEVDWAE